MGLAVPGRVLSIEGGNPAFRSANVDFCGVRKTVNLAFTPEVIVGDYVLVHVGFALTRVDICYSPIADVKEFPKVDIALVEGAVANEDHLREIRRIRRNSKVLIVVGDCAVTGNVTAMRNLFSLDNVLNRAYRENSAIVCGVPTGTAGTGGSGIVPRLLDRVLRIQDVVPVDHFLPGCPPSADIIYDFLSYLLAGRAPETVGEVRSMSRASLFNRSRESKVTLRSPFSSTMRARSNPHGFTSPSSADSRNCARDGPFRRCRA